MFEGVVDVESALWRLDDAALADSARAAQRARTAADVHLVQVAAAAEHRGLARAGGHTSTTAWLAAVAGLTRRDAAGYVALARLDVEAPATRAAWAAGELTTCRARIILGALDTLPDWCDPEAVDAAEHTLLQHADVLAADELRRLANRIVEVIDPDGADEILGAQLAREERRALDVTRLHFRTAGHGLVTIHGQLPVAQARMLQTALEAIASPRRTALENAADGRPVTACDSHDHQLGRALCALVEHLPTDLLPRTGGVAATLAITIDWDTLRTGLGTATLATGETMSAGQARRLACGAGLLPAVLDGPSAVLDYGRTRRLHSTAQRHALGARDRGCVFPGCDRPPGWCETHHADPWSAGGDTSLDNGVLLCSRHHHLVHEDWQLTRAPDGVWEVVPPARVDPGQRPRRHARFLGVPRLAA